MRVDSNQTILVWHALASGRRHIRDMGPELEALVTSTAPHKSAMNHFFRTDKNISGQAAMRRGTKKKEQSRSDFFTNVCTKGGNHGSLKPNLQQKKEAVSLNHSEYLEHFRNFLDGKKDDEDFSRLALGREKEHSIIVNLNLDLILPILQACYCPTVRRKPRDCLSMFRACLFMTLFRIQGINQWTKGIRFNALYSAARGFDPDDTPVVGAYYGFLQRIIDGP